MKNRRDAKSAKKIILNINALNKRILSIAIEVLNEKKGATVVLSLLTLSALCGEKQVVKLVMCISVLTILF